MYNLKGLRGIDVGDVVGRLAKPPFSHARPHSSSSIHCISDLVALHAMNLAGPHNNENTCPISRSNTDAVKPSYDMIQTKTRAMVGVSFETNTPNTLSIVDSAPPFLDSQQSNREPQSHNRSRFKFDFLVRIHFWNSYSQRDAVWRRLLLHATSRLLVFCPKRDSSTPSSLFILLECSKAPTIAAHCDKPTHSFRQTHPVLGSASFTNRTAQADRFSSRNHTRWFNTTMSKKELPQWGRVLVAGGIDWPTLGRKATKAGPPLVVNPDQ